MEISTSSSSTISTEYKWYHSYWCCLYYRTIRPTLETLPMVETSN